MISSAPPRKMTKWSVSVADAGKETSLWIQLQRSMFFLMQCEVRCLWATVFCELQWNVYGLQYSVNCSEMFMGYGGVMWIAVKCSCSSEMFMCFSVLWIAVKCVCAAVVFFLNCNEVFMCYSIFWCAVKCLCAIVFSELQWSVYVL